jgi:hypothetical protein
MSAAEKQPLVSADLEAASGGHDRSAPTLLRRPWVAAAALLLAACAAATAVYTGERGAAAAGVIMGVGGAGGAGGKLAALGGINLDCPKGMHAPTRRGPNPQFTVGA